MKATTLVLALLLSLGAGSAFAQTAPDISATTAADAKYAAGTSFNGVPVTGIDIATAVFITSSGTAEGHVAVDIFGPTNPLTGKQQIIAVEAMATGGTRSGNVTTITGTCTVDMGNGTPLLENVPFAATITTNAEGTGTVGLVIGATTLPAASVTAGSMTVTEVAD
jgi:hypothetical protein